MKIKELEKQIKELKIKIKMKYSLKAMNENYKEGHIEGYMEGYKEGVSDKKLKSSGSDNQRIKPFIIELKERLFDGIGRPDDNTMIDIVNNLSKKYSSDNPKSCANK